MYATRLGRGSGTEALEDRGRPVRRRLEYGVVRVPRGSRAADAAAGAAGAARASVTAPHGGRRRVRRWRRIVRNAVLAGLVLVVVGLVAARSVEGSAPAGGQTVLVQRGDTIWALASRQYPNSDPRTRVEQIERLNDLDGPVVRPGERLRLPAD